jgi:hypothetical protein
MTRFGSIMRASRLPIALGAEGRMASMLRIGHCAIRHPVIGNRVSQNSGARS